MSLWAVAVDAVRIELVSTLKFPANREINREFRKIRPSIAIFVSDHRANSRAYSRIPYATEQGISKRVSGNVFRGTGILTERAAKPAKPHTGLAVATMHPLTAQIRCPLLGGGLKRSMQHFISDARDGVDGDRSKICSRFQRGGHGGVVEPLAARIRSSTE
jgi:hypothetical protein